MALCRCKTMKTAKIASNLTLVPVTRGSCSDALRLGDLVGDQVSDR